MTPHWIKRIERAYKARRNLRRTLGAGAVRDAARARRLAHAVEREVTHPSAAHPFRVRIPGSDALVYKQVFVDREYEIETHEPPGVIIDAGANIGLTSILYATRFPDARIIAIEPARDNFALMEQNLGAYPNVTPVLGALAGEPGRAEIEDPGQDAWSYRTMVSRDGSGAGVEAMTVGQILERFGIDRVDLIKIDIEGAELEVMRTAGSWIGLVDAMVIELHERFRPGCTRAFYDATGGFAHEHHAGEHIWIAREGARVRLPGR